MIHTGDRESPSATSVDVEARRLADTHQSLAIVPPNVPGPDVARAETVRICWNREDEDAAGRQEARNLRERRVIVLDVLEHLAEHD